MNDNLTLFNKISSVFLTYTNSTLYSANNHIYINNYNLYYQFTNIFEQIHINYNKKDESDFNIILKDDMNFKVFVLSNCVVRICHIDKWYNLYQHTYSYLELNIYQNLEYIYNIYYTNSYIIVVSKCILALVNNNKLTNKHIINFDKLTIEITNQIINLAIDGFIHNDVCLDNIGYDILIDKYVLFDFDKLTTIKIKDSYQLDIFRLNKSINYYKDI